MKTYFNSLYAYDIKLHTFLFLNGVRKHKYHILLQANRIHTKNSSYYSI